MEQALTVGGPQKFELAGGQLEIVSLPSLSFDDKQLDASDSLFLSRFVKFGLNQGMNPVLTR